MVTIEAKAKLNLYLHVTGKRQDGYHILDSLFAFTGLADTVTIRPATTLSLSIDGPFSHAIGQDDNLIIKAATLLQTYSNAKTGAAIYLTKRIPVAAGLGGGSADAAAVLKGLDTLWQLGLQTSDLQQLALQLGADVVPCMAGKPTWVQGIGEVVTPLTSFPKVPALVVNPGKLLSTAQLFQHGTFPITPALTNKPIAFDTIKELITMLNSTDNVLTQKALEMVPEIDVVLTTISQQEGCLLSRMSGSGASCFGLFTDKHSCEAAMQTIQQSHPQWFVCATEVGSD